MKIYGRESADSDCPSAKLQNAKKIAKFVFANYETTQNLYWLTS